MAVGKFQVHDEKWNVSGFSTTLSGKCNSKSLFLKMDCFTEVMFM